MQASKVRVAVRLKPESARGRKCAFLNGKSTVIVGDKTFNYDHVYGENTTQESIYDDSVAPLVSGCFKGFNATVFAYGQTSAGKTHSIVGIPRCLEEEGIIPRALRQIFDYFQRDRTGRVVTLHISFLEIYNDECRDLLHPEIPSRDIMIREDKEGRIFFTGAREEVVTSVEDSLYYLERGNLSRTTAETFMNATSSRSHAIFSISIELFEYASPPSSSSSSEEDNGENTYIQSKLHLVDLAGSERAKRTGAEGQRLKESVGINQGLLALGKVIRALTAPKNAAGQQTAHVPYRESKLTRFLQDSLGGNSRTLMLACISPADVNMHETLSTLQYASRARAVQNKAIANVSVGVHSLPPDVDGGIVGALRTQLQMMQAELEQYKRSAPPRPTLDVRSSHVISSSSSPRHNVKSVSSALVEDLVRVASEAQCALQDAYASMGSAANNPAACGSAWQVVQACGEAATALEDMLDTAKQMRNLRQSLSDSLRGGLLPGAQDEEIRHLREELQECWEDLKRDEDIFAEKVRELKRCRKEIRELQQDKEELTSKLSEALRLTDQQRRLLEAQRPRTAPDTYAQSKGLDVGDGEDEDDLELSIAVASTEPDISQLMEDLEAISKEKEKLVTDKHIAESKEEYIAKAAERQREDFKRGQETMQRRLKELEINIRLKQELIADLTRGQNQATQLAERHEARVLLLEEESAHLQAQLDKLDQARRQTFEEAEEERSKRIELEGRLQEAQEYLQEMEQQRKRQEKKWKAEKEAEEKRKKEAKRTEEHLAELTGLQSAYARLSAQLEHDEHKHRKDLDSLTSQVAALKRSSGDSQQLIKQLEHKNAELRVRLERSAKASANGRAVSAPRPQSQSQSPAAAQMPPLPSSSSRQRTRSVASPSTPAWDEVTVGTTMTGATEQTGRSANSGTSHMSSASSRKGKQVSTDWLLRRVDDFTVARNARAEVSRLLSQCRAAEKEKSELQTELQQLVKQQREGEAALTRQISEVEGRLDKLAQLSKQYKVDLAAFKSNNNGDEVRRQACMAKLGDAERTLRSHLEHRTELQHRLSNGILSPDALSRLQDIRDELETLETEMSLNEVRLAEEKRRIKKAKSDRVDRGGKGGKVEEEAVEQTLLREMEEMGPILPEHVALAQVAQTLVDVKFRGQTDSQEVQVLQAKLDEQRNETEELVTALQRQRGEGLRRIEQQRVEYEEKIAFLLQQLRSSEQANTASTLRQSQEQQQHWKENPVLRASAVRKSDAQLSNLINAAVPDAESQQEIVRRWVSEKERREALEKRNSELVRELRNLRVSK